MSELQKIEKRNAFLYNEYQADPELFTSPNPVTRDFALPVAHTFYSLSTQQHDIKDSKL
jgi:hypothetical protein